MFKKLAIIALFGGVDAIRFALDNETDEDADTAQSIAEAEKAHGSKLTMGDKTMKAALAENNRLNFKEDEDFAKASKTWKSESEYVGIRSEMPKFYPGVTFIQSDPIHGSLGPPKVPLEDLTPEQAFEEKQRRMPAPDLKDDKETTIDTADSIKTAEKLVGAKMAEPSDPKQQKLIEESPNYKLHTSEDEDDDTRETRRSVKWVEKNEKQRFWINAREKKDYDRELAAGNINPKQVTFEEDDDEDLGPEDKHDKAAKKANKEAALKAADDAEADKKLSPEDKKKKEADAKVAEADAEAKKEKPDDKPEKAPAKKEAAADELPPELAGAAIQTRLEEMGFTMHNSEF